jgi:hypothetical protein
MLRWRKRKFLKMNSTWEALSEMMRFNHPHKLKAGRRLTLMVTLLLTLSMSKLEEALRKRARPKQLQVPQD